MNDTEELIKAALARSAGRAPHPGQIISALNSPRRRSRPLVLAIVGAVVVVAAVAVPIVFRSATAPVPPATEYTLPPSPKFVSTRFTVTDLPAGFVERSRTGDIDSGEVSRGWMRGNEAIHMSAYTSRSPRWRSLIQRGTPSIEIGRASGWWSISSANLAEIAWQPDSDTLIKVQVSGPDAPARAQRAAEAVRPDQNSGVRPVLSFGHLPTKFRRVEAQVYGSSPDTGQAWLRATVDDAQYAEVRARIVAAGTAKLDGWNVVVPAPGGREIELVYNSDSQLSELHALEIANGIKVEQEPDFSWLGK
jgi:hypothetical protein